MVGTSPTMTTLGWQSLGNRFTRTSVRPSPRCGQSASLPCKNRATLGRLFRIRGALRLREREHVHVHPEDVRADAVEREAHRQGMAEDQFRLRMDLRRLPVRDDAENDDEKEQGRDAELQARAVVKVCEVHVTGAEWWGFRRSGWVQRRKIAACGWISR